MNKIKSFFRTLRLRGANFGIRIVARESGDYLIIYNRYDESNNLNLQKIIGTVQDGILTIAQPRSK